MDMETTPPIRELVRELGRPGAYPHPAEDRRVHHTHISVVFLAGGFAYKVKKPLDLGFLDFTTLERRRRFCHEEVRLNRRLAPDVYLGVVPVTRGSRGLRFGGDGPALEWAVRMVRLPPEATLLGRLLRDELSRDTVEAVAARVAAFHAGAARGPEVSRHAGFSVVATNARDNLEQSADHVGETLSEPVRDRLTEALEASLSERRPLMEARKARHVPRDTHGDLHLDHVYLFPDRDPPGDLVIIDCIEFSDRFRCQDPVSDMAFLAMDLIHHGRRDLEARFSGCYFEVSGDEEGRELLAFYRSYRAAVRGKVEGMAAFEEAVPEEDRKAAVRRARGLWLLALAELEDAARRPGLVLVGGLPGTGKSTVAAGLAREAGFRLISSDRTRKELAGVPADRPAGSSVGEGIYSSEWTDRTYAACLEEVRAGLFRGERMLVDATFREEEKRRSFLDAGREHGVPVILFECRAEPATVRERLGARSGGPSDADWAVHLALAERWEEPSPASRRLLRVVRTEGSPEASVARALDHLAAAGLRGAGR